MRSSSVSSMSWLEGPRLEGQPVADARVIPIGGERPRRSSAGGTEPNASTPGRTSPAPDAVAAGPSRASGERARRRQASPLIDQSAIAAAEARPARQARQPRPKMTPDVVEQASDVSIPSHQTADLERKIAGALAFVRRRITGEA